MVKDLDSLVRNNFIHTTQVKKSQVYFQATSFFVSSPRTSYSKPPVTGSPAGYGLSIELIVLLTYTDALYLLFRAYI